MARPFIVVGDTTTHGGVVIQGSPTNDIHGRAIARVGDAVSCPKHGHGSINVIITGDPTCLIDDQPAARDGDLISCGALLISTQSSATD